MTLCSFFLFLHELFFRPEQEYSFRATWRAFFFFIRVFLSHIYINTKQTNYLV